MTLGKSEPEAWRLLRTRTPFRELILGLPDRASRHYVEFKLWDAKVSAVAGFGGRQVVFEADTIECLTG